MEQAYALYQSGLPLTEIAKQCGITSGDTVATRFRENNLPIRGQGNTNRTKRGNIEVEIRTCVHPDCTNQFQVWKSQTKKFCQASCRYTDPSVRAQLSSWQTSGKHYLSEIDEVSRTAQCVTCGNVKIRRPKKRVQLYTESVYWSCQNWEREQYWRKEYGVEADFILDMYAAQEGKCVICRRVLSDKFSVDHNHDTGVIRGILCTHCNTGLGLFQDSPMILQEAITYLEERTWYSR